MMIVKTMRTKFVNADGNQMVLKPTQSLPLLLAFSLLGGCAGDEGMTDLTDYVAEVKSQQKIRIEPLPEIKTAETFAFNPEGLRNPFQPAESVQETVSIKVGNGVLPDQTRPKEELESFSLDSLRMVGTVTQKDILWGLIKTGDGTIHRVKQGNHMGQNHGKIVRVVEERVELVEILQDEPGLWREQQATLALAD